jgi:hypothetical protein
MPKKIKIFIFAMVGMFALMQIYQPQRNSHTMKEDHILIQENIPGRIQTILERSCFDCHSDITNYPGYSKIAPASWLIAHHIKEGKAQLNFSEWGKTDIVDKISNLGKIQDEVKSGEMPLSSYTFIHRKAKLSAEQVEEMTSWGEKLSEQLLQEEEKP